MDKELLEKCLNIIENLNESIGAILGEETPHFFSITTDNISVSIHFDGVMLWHSAEHEVAGDLEEFVKEEYNNYVKGLQKLKFLNYKY